jgi:hypothetical protein
MNIQFNPVNLRPVRQLHAEGKIPYKLRYVLKKIYNREFPAVKVGKEWMTTETAVKAHFWTQANEEFKKISV